MADSREDPPLHSDTSRSLWIGWGAALVSIPLSFLVGGNFFPYLCLFIAIVMIVRGWKPAIFAHHIDEQIIAGTPYRREESFKAWSAAVVLAVTLAGLGSWIHSTVAPGSPDIAVIIRDAITKGLEQQAKNIPNTVPLPLPDPPSKPEPPPEIPKDQGSLTLKLTPYVVVERLFAKSDNPEIQGFAIYDFSLVLHARNNYRTPKNIRQIEISGNAPLDFIDYMGSQMGNGLSLKNLQREFIQRSPYYSLSLVTYPKGGSRIDGDTTERFIQFDLMKSNSYGARMFNDRPKDYVGYKNPAMSPKKLTTEPNLKDLITFSRRDPHNFLEWQGPELREGITQGTIQFAVVVDAAAIKVNPSNINPVQWTLKKNWLEANPADLYFQGEYGYPLDRKAVSGSDPAIQGVNPDGNKR
jgi:hypothetical protein